MKCLKLSFKGFCETRNYYRTEMMPERPILGTCIFPNPRQESTGSEFAAEIEKTSDH